MKHRRVNKTLGLAPDRRAGWLRTVTGDLLRHGSIITTRARAKVIQRRLEPLITKARGKLTLADRRQLWRRLGRADQLARLTKVADRHRRRPGGYTRITRLPRTRHDQAPAVKLEIIDYQSSEE